MADLPQDAGTGSSAATVRRPAKAAPANTRSGQRSSLRGQQLWRRLHSWTSLTSLVVMLFFGLTGVLLNHTSWTFGQQPASATASGTLPSSVKSGSGVDFLAVSQYVRSTNGVTGEVNGHGTSGTSAYINYLGPGYTANVTFDTSTLAYKVVSQKQGWVGVLDDVHRSKGTGAVWSVVNDLSGVLLVVIGITGLLITFMTRAKHKRRDLALAGIGLVLAVVAIVIATRS